MENQADDVIVMFHSRYESSDVINFRTFGSVTWKIGRLMY
jgi:hypothetical protein